VVVVKAGYLVNCARRLVPALHRQLLHTAVLVGTPAEARALNRAYATIPRLEFDSAILEPSLAHLAISLLPEPWPGSERPVATPAGGLEGSPSC
jgi:hypothetical protein